MFNDRNRSGGRGFSRGRSYEDNLQPIKNDNPPITDFKKDFYEPVNTITDSEAEKLRDGWNMKVKGENIPSPVVDFHSLGFKKCLIDYFTGNKFEAPTPIQAQGWPMALSGRDFVGVADTGSGKTLAFLIPALIHAVDQPPIRPGDGPIVLILAPTRELVMQIDRNFIEANKYFKLKSTCVYGGVSAIPQKKSIIAGTDIIVATPGRLIDLHEQGTCNLDRVTFLVLDEADRMLDMGFKDQLDRIIPKTNPNRQTLMWSATWPKEVRQLANDYTSKDYISVTIGSGELRVNSKISQEIKIVSVHDKIKAITQTIGEFMASGGGRVIIFTNTKSSCNKLEYLLGEHHRAAAIHGDKSQAARESIIYKFTNGTTPILVATDVAARGLDIKNVNLVVNYDLPHQTEEYVHRVGRTARGSEESGKSISFFSPEEDSGNAKKFLEIFQAGANSKIPKEIFAYAEKNRGYSQPSRYSRRGGGYGKSSYSNYSNRYQGGGANRGDSGYNRGSRDYDYSSRN